MKKNLLYIGLAGVILTGNTSCDDQLNALPTQSIVEENVIYDAQSAETALNGVYYNYAMVGTDPEDMPSTRSALYYEILPAMFTGVANYGYGSMGLEYHNNENYGDYLWGPLYTIITAANNVISRLADAPDEWFTGNRKNGIMAEARLLRAFSYYNLLRWYAQYWDTDSKLGLVLRDEPSSVYNQNKDRSSVAESYQFILDDIEYAITNAPDERPNYYLNKWVAKGLKARMLMLRGEENDYANAATLAKEIIDNGPYALEENLKDIFFSKALNSNEVMFGITPRTGQCGESYQYLVWGSTPYYPLSTLAASLFENDPRKEWALDVRNTIDYDTYEYVDKSYNHKHLNPTTGAYSDLTETCYQMRLTEMYLLRAEALVYTNGDKDEIKQLLKDVESKAGIEDFSTIENADTDNALLREIYVETIRNQFFESGRELDPIMRMPYEVIKDFCPYAQTPDIMILPIPGDEFRFNQALKEQNPGYSKN